MPEILVYILIKLILVIVVFALWMTMVPVMIWLERKVIADIQVRIGPNRVGPFGLLQPIADAIKLVMKEDLTPGRADKWIYSLAPVMLMVPAILAMAVIPIGGVVHIGPRSFALQIMGYYSGPGLVVPELDSGILLSLALSSLGVYGVVLSGWSSASKYSLLGGMRSSAQMLSYELPLGVSLIGPLLLAGTLRLSGVVEAQHRLGVWFVVPQFLAFVVFLIAGTAEVNRSPFDLPEAEQELIGGYHTEYSGFRFAMFFMAEYLNMVTISALAVTFFFGGYLLPFNGFVWLQPVWFALKLLAVLYFFIWMRGTFPRVRYDQLMKMGWKSLLPLAIINFVITAAVRIFFPRWELVALTVMSVAITIVAFFALNAISARGMAKLAHERPRRAAERREAGERTFP
jgi:NADH-quinone oxidoreductase subunit H